jgi:hypothetical protein
MIKKFIATVVLFLATFLTTSVQAAEVIWSDFDLLIRPHEVSTSGIFDSGVLEEALDALG